MIASRLGLAALAVAAAILAVVLAIDLRRAPPPLDRSLLPGLDVERITQLEWTRPGTPTVVVIRDGTEWRWAAPIGGVADAHTTADAIAALRGGHWHRRSDAATAGAVHATLTVRTADSTRMIGLGAALPGTEQSWLVVDDRALLVDSWLARALEPSSLALRVRKPFTLESGTIVALRDGVELRVGGEPARIATPAHVVADPALVGALDRALAALTIIRVPATPIAAASRLVIDADHVHVALGGRCPGADSLVAMDASTGAGCVTAEAAAAVDAAVARLSGPATEVVDHRPCGVAPLAITLGDAGMLDLARRPRFLAPEPHDADLDRVDELRAALLGPGEPVAAPHTKPIARVVVAGPRGEQVELALHPGNVVQRTGDEVGLRIPAPQWSILARPARAYFELALWAEEPTTIATLTVDGVTYTRGATIGEWTRDPAGKLDPRALDALAAELAHLHAVAATVPTAIRVQHRVAVVVMPPVGAATTHLLELAADCAARVDGTTVQLAGALCAAVARTQ